MKAQLTAEQLYFNNSLCNFFLRNQSYKTLQKIIDISYLYINDTLKSIDEYFEDIDNLDEVLYNESAEDIADMIGIKTK